MKYHSPGSIPQSFWKGVFPALGRWGMVLLLLLLLVVVAVFGDNGEEAVVMGCRSWRLRFWASRVDDRRDSFMISMEVKRDCWTMVMIIYLPF